MEATARLAQFGPNDVAMAPGFGALRALAGYATNPLVLILGVTPPPPASFAFLIVVVLMYLAMVELLKSRVARPAESVAAHG